MKKFFDKTLDESILVYYILNRQRNKTLCRCENICGDQRFRLPPTFSLLWTLVPAPSLECPISFSPFLPFGTLGNTAGNGGVFLYNKNT